MDHERQRIAEDLRGVVAGEVLCDDASRALYATDGSLFEVWPLAVVRPRNVDDVAFTRAILDDLETVARVDPRRVFATGMSNGAMMAYRVAAELSDRIAAIAPVGGPMGIEECAPEIGRAHV